jgi:hypothetical protein
VIDEQKWERWERGGGELMYMYKRAISRRMEDIIFFRKQDNGRENSLIGQNILWK